MGIILSLFRRFFGGYDSKYDVLENRGVQCAFCILVVLAYRLCVDVWWSALATAILVYIFFCKGHYYYFLCGMESDQYIDEQEKKGRKPAMDWIVRPVNKLFGFAPRSRQYCFVGMLLRYGLWSIPVSLFVGWQFVLVGLSVPFIYNACFWVEFPSCRLAKSPTNWAELITGFITGWGLL
jgi:hypothetical protein